VELVCPGFSAAPDAVMSRLTRRLAERLPKARVLSLHAGPLLTSTAPAVDSTGAGEVWRFSPDLPLPRETSGELPGSSALETAVCASEAPALFLGADTQVARDAVARLGARAWGVTTSSERPPGAPDYGERLIPLDIVRMDETVDRITRILETRGGSRAR
jgi:hypothetical protein